MGIFRRDRRKHNTTREVASDLGTEFAGEHVATGLFRVLRRIVHAILHGFA